MLKDLFVFAFALTASSLLLSWPAAAADVSTAPVCSPVEAAPAVAVETPPASLPEEAAASSLVSVQPAVDPRAGSAAEGDAFVHSSSRSVKEGFAAIDSSEILARVVGLPLTTWSYKSDDGQFRHLGPMAEDFFAAFSLGRDEKGISLIDTGGVALAAIQGLYHKLEEKEAEVETLRQDSERKIDAISRQNADLAARLAALEEQLQSFVASPPAAAPKGVEVAPAVQDPPRR